MTDTARGVATRRTRDEGGRRQGFLARHRLPLVLGVIALCLYVGSILYIVYVRGPL